MKAARSGFSIQEHLGAIRQRQIKAGHTLVRGACSELIACAWLLENGWEVFRNVSARGWGDICAFKVGGTPIAIDVKTVRFNPETMAITRPRISDRQEQAGIIPLYVTDDGICSFALSDIEALYRGAAASSWFNDRKRASAKRG